MYKRKLEDDQRRKNGLNELQNFQQDPPDGCFTTCNNRLLGFLQGIFVIFFDFTLNYLVLFCSKKFRGLIFLHTLTEFTEILNQIPTRIIPLIGFNYFQFQLFICICLLYSNLSNSEIALNSSTIKPDQTYLFQKLREVKTFFFDQFKPIFLEENSNSFCNQATYTEASLVSTVLKHRL